MHEVLNSLITFVEAHKNYAYFLLFIGACIETIFPISVFVYGEVFFLAGSILAGIGLLKIWIIAPLLILWGIVWDNISFHLGRYFWKNILNFLRHHPFFWKILHQRNYQYLKKHFKERWGYTVFIARFWGPLSRITPFFAGSFKLPYSTFLLFNTPWVVWGIWMFIIVWYYFGQNFDSILNIIGEYLLWVWIVFVVCLICFYVYRRYNTKKEV